MWIFETYVNAPEKGEHHLRWLISQLTDGCQLLSLLDQIEFIWSNHEQFPCQEWTWCRSTDAWLHFHDGYCHCWIPELLTIKPKLHSAEKNLLRTLASYLVPSQQQNHRKIKKLIWIVRLHDTEQSLSKKTGVSVLLLYQVITMNWQLQLPQP